MSSASRNGIAGCQDCEPVNGQSSTNEPIMAVPKAGESTSTAASGRGGEPTSGGSDAVDVFSGTDHFEPPAKVTPAITIEFCDRCRWAPRATWVQTELFLTFPTPTIRSITLIPLTAPETGGRFRVWVDLGNRVELAWDRKTEGGFPELKVLKQRIRNVISPDMGLGHSDKPGANKGLISVAAAPTASA